MTPIENILNDIIVHYKSPHGGMAWSELEMNKILNNLKPFDINSKYDVLVCKMAISMIKRKPAEVLDLVKEFSSEAEAEIQGFNIWKLSDKEYSIINTYMKFVCFASRSLFVTGNTQYAWFVFQRGTVVSRHTGFKFPVTDNKISIGFHKKASIGFHNGMESWR